MIKLCFESSMKLILGFFFFLSLVLIGCDNSTQSHTKDSAKNPEPFLDGLRVSVGTLAPTFDSSILAYTDSVSYGTDSVKLTPETSVESGTSAFINGVAATTDQSSAFIPLAHGSNTVSIVV